jgi:hypothetical protein
MRVRSLARYETLTLTLSQKGEGTAGSSPPLNSWIGFLDPTIQGPSPKSQSQSIAC